MKRFHLHGSVKDLDESVRFYSTPFATPPAVGHADYVKWISEDPRIRLFLSLSIAGLDPLRIKQDMDAIGRTPAAVE